MTYTDVQRTNPARCKEQLIEWLNGMDEGLGEGRLASHSGLRARMLRAFLWLASDNGRFFDQSHRSADCIAISREYLPPGAPPRVVISGHTHAAREVWLTPDHVYINTGTWTDLMKLPSRIDDAMLKEWIDSLERREIPRIQRLTYADVTATDVALREFRP